mmetsp:Transcript_14905/g.12681  ORF Transcript_14905/g.12681 Transcript_14905/m.12681 type:complete len:105 (-) Transcript_14905:1618-1932(-)
MMETKSRFMEKWKRYLAYKKNKARLNRLADRQYSKTYNNISHVAFRAWQYWWKKQKRGKSNVELLFGKKELRVYRMVFDAFKLNRQRVLKMKFYDLYGEFEGLR